MYLQNLYLVNFKNYTAAEFQFTKPITVFTGDNGSGKTNVLDAIHYLSITKSYFNAIDSQQIRHGEDFFVVSGTLNKEEQDELLYCGVKRNQKKVFKRNKKDYPRLADHIGFLPITFISPNDSMLITEGSEERRKFMDTVLAQTDSKYLDTLLHYNKALANRNALLKHFADTRTFDEALLAIYDSQLIEFGTSVYEIRKEFINAFIPLFHAHYQFLSSTEETVNIEYLSPLHDAQFAQLLNNSIQKDRVLERTTVGIHKDDLDFLLDTYPLKRLGSQGQQKSFIIALKLAQYSYLLLKKKVKPLLLLDDIFDKLDEKRIAKLLQLVADDTFGQVFITDSHAKRIKKMFADISIDICQYEITKGVAEHV